MGQECKPQTKRIGQLNLCEVVTVTPLDAGGGDVVGGDAEGGGWLSAASSVKTKRTSDCSSHSGV